MIKGSELARKLGCEWQSEDPLIIPEVWDVASARILVEAGFPTLTTSAAAYAWAQGYRPGERVGLEELLVVAGRIIRDCQKPIVADLEGCFDRSNRRVSVWRYRKRALVNGWAGCTDLQGGFHYGWVAALHAPSISQDAC